MQAKPDGMADAALKSFLILLLPLSAFWIHHAFPSGLEDRDHGFPLTLWKALRQIVIIATTYCVLSTRLSKGFISFSWYPYKMLSSSYRSRN